MPWRRRARPLLGTRVEVGARIDGAAAFCRASDAAFAVVAAHHAAMSFHAHDSDVAAIASAGAGRVLTVAESTWRVLRFALRLEAESNGAFNVAVAPRLVAVGRLPRPAEWSTGGTPANSALDALDLLAGSRVRVVRPVWIDLGGIAKGAAVDAALATFAAARGDSLRGVVSALVNAGGDLATCGPDDHAVHVRGPARGGPLHAAGRLGNGAIATSAPVAGEGARALVSDRRAAAWGDRSVSVLAPTCMVADALTKVVAVLGAASARILAAHGARAFSIDVDGRVAHVG